MLIEAHASEDMLQEIRLNFEDQLQNAGYASGPRLGSMDAGRLVHYVKEDSIVSIQITEESEAGDCALKIESEQEIAELYEFWDAALITYCKNIRSKLMEFAHDRTRVEQGLN